MSSESKEKQKTIKKFIWIFMSIDVVITLLPLHDKSTHL